MIGMERFDELLWLTSTVCFRAHVYMNIALTATFLNWIELGSQPRVDF